MPQWTSSTRNDYEQKINYDWPHFSVWCPTDFIALKT